MNTLISRSNRQMSPVRIVVPEGGIRMLESHHAIGFKMELNTWPFHKICWVAEGCGGVDSGKDFTAVERDDFLFLPADWSHRFVDAPGNPLTLVMFCISGKFVSGADGRHRGDLWRTVTRNVATGISHCARSAFLHSRLREYFRRAVSEQQRARAGWEMAVVAVTEQLLVDLGRGVLAVREGYRTSSRHAVAGAIEYLDAHPFGNIQIGDMAARCGLSRRRFTDLFREQTGDSFTSYLNRRRIEHACERLDRTGHILYACHQAGFNDLAYFYRVFRKYTGESPGSYLRRSGARGVSRTT